MRKILFAIGGFLLVCLITLGIWIYVQGSVGQEVYIYYFNARTNQLESERRIIAELCLKETIRTVIHLMYANPKNSSLRQTIPDDLFFNYPIRMVGGVMHADFPQNYHDMTPYEEALFRASLVRTMTSLPFVDSVLVLVDGEMLYSPLGEPMGAGDRSNVLVGEPIMPRRVFRTTVTLYFINAELNGLSPEVRTFDRPAEVPIEKAIIEQLKLGSTSYGLHSSIPSGTRILDVRTDARICTINLSSEFVSNFTGGQALAELTLRSILHSIMQNDRHMTGIQFLIESERVETFNGVPYFDIMFERVME